MKSLSAKDARANHASGHSMAGALMERAYALINVKRWGDAIPLLHQVLVIEPDHYDALCALGECLRALGQIDEALSNLERAAARLPGEQQAFSMMALTFIDKWERTRSFQVRERKRCCKRALSLAEMGVKLAPESPQALTTMTGVILKFYSPKKAVPYIERHLRLQPNHHYAYGNMAAVKFRLREFGEAESFARRALEINPLAVNTMATLGAVLISKRRYREAIKILNQALAISPNHPEAKGNLALAGRRLFKEANSADLPDGTKKSKRQIMLEGLMVIGAVALCLLMAIPIKLLWMKTFTFEQAVGVSIMCAGVPLIIGHTIWRRREFNRLPKGTQILLQKEMKRKYPWLP